MDIMSEHSQCLPPISIQCARYSMSCYMHSILYFIKNFVSFGLLFHHRYEVDLSLSQVG